VVNAVEDCFGFVEGDRNHLGRRFCLNVDLFEVHEHVFI
jgi:hypothetical protein